MSRNAQAPKSASHSAWGNMRELMDSLFHKLYALDGYTVYPGHEESTTIEHEKQFNPMNAYRDHPWFS